MRVLHRGATKREGAGHSAEEAGVVGDIEAAARRVVALNVVETRIHLVGAGGAAHLRQPLQRVEIKTEPVRRVVPPQPAVDLFRFPAFQPLAQFRLHLGDAVLAAQTLIADAEDGERVVVQLAQQLRLPVVPRSRPNRPDIERRQHEEELQPLDASHLRCEGAHRCGVGDVALLREIRHDKVIANQPDDHLCLSLVQPETRADLGGDLRSDNLMRARVALADVMEKQSEIEDRKIHAPLHDLGRHRQILDQFAADKPVERSDGQDRMLIHRIVVVHVELHQRDDALKLGDKGAENAGLVHPSQRPFRIAAFCQQPHEYAVRFRITPQLVVDKVQFAHDDAVGVGMNQGAGSQTFLKEPQNVDRILVEPAFVADIHAPVADVKSLALRPSAAEGPGAHPGADGRAGLFLIAFKRGAEKTGQFADFLGVAEIPLHEDFDAAPPVLILESETGRQLHLIVEGELFLRASGEVMKVTAHGPEKTFGGGEDFRLIRFHDAFRDQVADFLDVVDVFGDPEERLKVAQPALSFLDVRLDQIARSAVAGVAGVALRQFRFDEFLAGAEEQFLSQRFSEAFGQRGVAPDEPLFQKRSADGDVFARKAGAFRHGPDGLTDFQPEIPKEIQRVLDRRLRRFGRVGGRQKKQVDVRERRHFATTIAADRHNGETGVALNVAGCEGQRPDDERICRIGDRPRHARPRVPRRAQPRQGGGPAFLHLRTERGNRRRARIRPGRGGRQRRVKRRRFAHLARSRFRNRGRREAPGRLPESRSARP